MVESRCAITKVVRPFITSSSAALTLASVTASSALVASSRIRIGGSFSSARAIDSRCRSPPESMRPRSPAWVSNFLLAALDEFERLRARRRDAHLLFGRVRLADAQIVGDRAVEQQRFLEHHADVPPQRGQLQAADVHAVDLDDAGLRIEGAVQQRDRGRFAGAGRADQRDGLAGQRGEGKVLDRGPLAVIGKRHVVEFDQAREPPGVDRVGPVAHRGHRVEHVEEFLQARRFHEHAVDEADHLFELLDQHGGESRRTSPSRRSRRGPAHAGTMPTMKIARMVMVVEARVSTE